MLIEHVCPRCGEEKFSFDDFCSECIIELEDSGIDDPSSVEYNEELESRIHNSRVRAIHDDEFDELWEPE